jgi:hypothetical protein
MKLLLENWRRYVNEETGFNVNIEARLADAAERDQDERNELASYYEKYGKSRWREALGQFKKDKGIGEGDDVFTVFTPLLKSLLPKIEWDSLSQEGWDNLWLLVQHADDDRNLQKAALQKFMKHQPGTKNTKYLSDRIECAEKGTQTYGTQDMCEKED